MNQTATARVSDAVSDSLVNHKVCTFQRELNLASTPFGELPQPMPQDGATGLRNKELVHAPRGSASERTITQDGRIVNPCLMARPPPGARAKPLALRRQHDSPRLQRCHP